MKCKKCKGENVIKYGLRRGKTCFLCKDCGHQFTNETAKYNDFDKYIVRKLYMDYMWHKKVNKFINAELRLTYIAKLLNIKYTTIALWAEKSQEEKGNKELIQYLKTIKNGKDICGLLYPEEVPFKPSDYLLSLIKHKK